MQMEPGTRLLALLLGALLSACGSEPQPRPRVLFFAIDGADWEIAGPLMERGEMPHLAGLVKRGIKTEVDTFEPIKSPLIWTSVATGRAPEAHGIQRFVEPDATGKLLPVTSNMRRVKAVWNILTELDRKVGVVGWLVTWPAEEVNGVLVSSVSPFVLGKEMRGRGASHEAKKGAFFEEVPGLTWPAELAAEVARFKRSREEVRAEVAARFGTPLDTAEVSDDEGWPPSLADSEDRRTYLDDLRGVLDGMTYVYAADLTFSRMGEHLYRTSDADLFMVYLGGVDVVCHRFWKFRAPGQFPVREQDRQRYAGLIEEYYRFVDEELGRYLAIAGDETTVIVASDHGFTGRAFTGRHSPNGEHRKKSMLAMAGPGIRPGATVRDGSLIDLLPTMLYLLDLPVADDMEGRILREALDSGLLGRREPLRVATYETGNAGDESPLASPVDEEILEQFRSLGYIE